MANNNFDLIDPSSVLPRDIRYSGGNFHEIATGTTYPCAAFIGKPSSTASTTRALLLGSFGRFQTIFLISLAVSIFHKVLQSFDVDIVSDTFLDQSGNNSSFLDSIVTIVRLVLNSVLLYTFCVCIFHTFRRSYDLISNRLISGWVNVHVLLEHELDHDVLDNVGAPDNRVVTTTLHSQVNEYVVRVNPGTEPLTRAKLAICRAIGYATTAMLLVDKYDGLRLFVSPALLSNAYNYFSAPVSRESWAMWFRTQARVIIPPLEITLISENTRIFYNLTSQMNLASRCGHVDCVLYDVVHQHASVDDELCKPAGF